VNERETVARALIADFAAGRFKDATKRFRWWMRWVVRPSHLAAMAAQLGVFQRMLDVQSDDEGITLLCDFERAAIDVRLFFDRRNTIVGLLFEPSTTRAAPTRFAGYVTKTPLHLPFDGEWVVFWGGRTIEENHHASTADQRFAYDFLRDGCWDAPIYAPAAGRVTETVDGIDDAGTNLESPAGNHVVIDHENGEYSVLAHLRRGSVAVRAGDRVESGTLIGRCGNSGHSSEPHLHYHLQNAPAFGRGDGLPAQFRDYLADGVRVEVGEPRQGQRLRGGST
jgi:Peptidase family M23